MRLFAVFVVGVMLFSGVAYAGDGLLSSDPMLFEAMDALKEGENLMREAEQEVNRRPELAREILEQAEGNFIRAARLYSELGAKHDIRVVNEVSRCEKLARKAGSLMGRIGRTR